MRQLYLNMVNTKQTEYLECWKIYMDLVETEFNPEDISFYDWDLISYHHNYNQLDIYKRNMNDNMSIIINLVEEIIKDITNKTTCYIILDDNIILTKPFTSDLIKCNDCGNIWDGFSQCNCFISNDINFDLSF